MRRDGFHYTDAVREVAADIVATLPELRHVRLAEVAFAFSPARQRSTHGTYAECVPLRFQDGNAMTTWGGATWAMPTLEIDGRQMLYVLYFRLPRFHEEGDYNERLAIIIHELYHIHPLFNGALRTFRGRNDYHGGSVEGYHNYMRDLATHYRATSPQADRHDFLRTPLQELERRHGAILGTRISRPGPVRLAANTPAPGSGVAGAPRS